MEIDIAAPPRRTTFAGSLARSYAALFVVGLPLAAVMLTPGLMRSRVEFLPGVSKIGIFAFLALSVALVLAAPVVSAVVDPAPGWRRDTVRRVGRALRRELPRRWWLRLGEAALIFLGSQLVGGMLAWMIPYIWRDEAGTGWVLHHPNYALQAVSMYLVIVLAAAWFGTRLRALARQHTLVDHGTPLS